MLRSRQMLTLRLLFVSFLLAATAQAQEASSPDLNSMMPRCGPPMDGEVFCKFGRIYECQYINPNSLERRTGWRWKSDILRSCNEPRPASEDPPAGLPPGFTYAPGMNTGSPAGQPGLAGTTLPRGSVSRDRSASGRD